MAAEDLFSITKLKSSLAQGGARPSLFSASISYPRGLGLSDPPTKAKFLIKASQIPASTIGSYDVFFHGMALKVAGDRTHDTLDTTIYNDEDYGVRKVLEKWMKMISHEYLNIRKYSRSSSALEGTGAKYKSTITLTEHSKAGGELRTYTFHGAWPSNLSAIALDWGSASDIEEFVCTWTYDYWDAKDGSSPSASGSHDSSTSESNVPTNVGNPFGYGG